VKVLVTGAAGFLGRAVVDAALQAGHDVVALVRPASDDLVGHPWSSERLEVVRGDLRQRGPWCDDIGGVDAIIHVAAATSGSLSEQFAGTVTGTENLLAAVAGSTLERFVHVSSFSVYDYSAVGTGRVIDERTPLETRPDLRDAYTTTKLLQETLVREACEQAGHDLVVARPGVIYGPGSDWDHGAALSIGPMAVVFSPHATFRLVHVDNCAAALVSALSADAVSGRTVNLIDDDLPTHLEYFRRCRSAGLTRAYPVPVPWRLVELVGRAFDLIDRLVPGRHLKLPELVELRRQRARWKPFTYPNDDAKRLLGWTTPRVCLSDALRGMRRAER
jgi:2-alkyl-3-oxoalkanoate reductase